MSVSTSCTKSRFLAVALAIVAASFFSTSALAQSDTNPKWDLFIGYQWLHPGGTVPTPGSDPNNPTPFNLPDSAKGGGVSLTYNFDPHWGGEIDYGSNAGNANVFHYENELSIGPRFIWRTDDANYFLHGLVSLNRVKVNGLDANDGIGAILGGGMDLPITKNVAWRLFEADYVWARHNFADFAAPEFPDLRRPSFEGVRLRTGVVFSWGGAPVVPPAVSVSVQPNEVLVGEPMTATAAASNFNPKHTLAYAWTVNGGQVSGTGTTAQISTTNAAPGAYVVTVHVTDPKEKKNNEASGTASFTVKALPPKNPPTMSITASPSTVPAGGTVNLSANCTSPDGVSVDVATWTSTGGTVSGSGTSATLNTTGATPGTITVGATCTDSRGLTGQGSAQVMVENPPPPPPNPEIVRLESRLNLHSVYFPTAKPPASNPNAGLLPTQQKTLMTIADDFKHYLELKPEAHLILGGHADHRGSVEYNQALSERRVNRVKAFLVQQGVAEANIDTKAYGKEDNLTSAQVIDEVSNNPELSSEEKQRITKNIVTIRMASNRRVDVTLSTTGQTSVRQFPFNTTDSLTLIGGREGEAKKKTAKPAPKKKSMKKQ
jgi:outer membrane protein OmpA-like peptidoglycan-associated protein